MKTTKRLLCLLVALVMLFSVSYVLVACGEEEEVPGTDDNTGGSTDTDTDESAAFAYTSYARAGYGLLSFRSDFGPTQYTGVRQALSYLIDTADFAQAFTGGYGSVVYGPFGVDTAGYVANEDELSLLLTEYSVSAASATKCLIEAGFVYNASGEDFDADVDTVRYVKLEGEYLTADNKAYGSTNANADGLKTVKIGDDYFMPLVLNWLGTEENTVSDMLITYMANSTLVSGVGMKVTMTIGDFNLLLGQLYQMDYGTYTYSGVATYNVFNLATSFTSSIYDYSWNWSIDPEYWDWSAFFNLDSADFVDLGTGVFGTYDDDGNWEVGTFGTDYNSQYWTYGSDISVDDVYYSEDGLPVVLIDDVETELGMDFLSMAMVYNTDTSEDLTATEEYNLWFQYYVVRWNYLMPNIPLYSNEYYDVYSSEISGFETTAYWQPSDAIVNATTSASDNSVAMGVVTEASGNFYIPAWGVSSANATDSSTSTMIHGYSTLSMDMYGGYDWDDNVVASHSETENDDNSKTFTVTINSGLTFNDGTTAITAEHYLIYLLANSTQVGVAGGGTGTSGQSFVGFDDFKADVDGGSFFSGVKMSADKMTFSLTVDSAYLPYYYDFTYASATPYDLQAFFGIGFDSSSLFITLDTTGVTEGGVEVFACGLSDAFYATTEVSGAATYTVGAAMKTAIGTSDGTLLSAGPYMLTSTGWNSSTSTVTVVINPYFTGEANRNVPTIQNVSFVYVTSSTMIDLLATGGVDMLNGITGGDDTDAALALCK